MMQERQIEEYLARLAVPRQRPAMSDLRGLSDLSSTESHTFWEIWQTIPEARRRALAQAMQELAEENPDLDFREVFLRCLADTNADVRLAAVQGLWEDDRLSTLRRLLQVMNHDEAQEVRAAAATGLGHFSYMAAVEEIDEQVAQDLLEALLETFHRPGETVEVRRRALESLGYYSDDPDVIAIITAAFASGEELWQQSALFAMGRSMSPRWMDEVSAALRSDRPALRYEAARASGEFGEQGRSLLPALLPLADDPDSEVAMAAIWALGQIGGQQARQTLKRIMRSADASRREAAEEALHELEFFEDPLFGQI
ncbi:MAG: PBS lyase [Herpetosiphonaceae bacterium]|nr:MAG: PBS lyase [Herpetosiphonaceae bacterium]